MPDTELLLTAFNQVIIPALECLLQLLKRKLLVSPASNEAATDRDSRGEASDSVATPSA